MEKEIVEKAFICFLDPKSKDIYFVTVVTPLQ